MIFARRVMAVLLGGLFLVSLLGALLVLRTSETFLRPEFYPEQFEESGVYRFVMGDVLTSVLDDVRAMEADDSGAGMSGNPSKWQGSPRAKLRRQSISPSLPGTSRRWLPRPSTALDST